MARYAGFIGYEVDEYEDPNDPGVWIPKKMIRRFHTGDLLTHKRKWETSAETTMDGVRLNNKISIVADKYMTDHWPCIKYAELSGVKWKVESVEIKRPRIILDLGGIWNGDKAGASC